MIVEHLNLYRANDNTNLMCQGLVSHVGQLLANCEYERIRGVVESLAWFDRTGYGEIMRTFGPHIKNVMTSEPTEPQEVR
jgi:hypothetical protein